MLKPITELASLLRVENAKECTTVKVLGAFAGLAVAGMFLWPSKVHVSPSDLVVVITGCDSGFGLTLSTRLADAGYHVVSTCLTQNGVNHLKGKVELAVLCDVTKDVEVECLSKLVEELLLSKKLKVWAVVNNAGIAPLGNLDWSNLDLFKRAVEVNYFGAVAMAKYFLPFLKRSKDSRIINVSSVAGFHGTPGYGAYCGSKHALEGMMKCLRYELQPWNIRVVNINPSYMRTPLIATSGDNMLIEFNKAPSDIREQYNPEGVTKTTRWVTSVQEDPIIVILKIEEVLTLKNPTFNHYVGRLSTLARFWLLVPPYLREMVDFRKRSRLSPKVDAVKAIQGESKK